MPKFEYPYKGHAETAQRDDKAKAALKIVPMLEGSKVRAWALMPAADAEIVFKAIRAALGPMNIELRKVHFAAFNSEETNCFDAEIWINGKKEGHCDNQGHGGPTSVSPHSLSDRLDVYGATLPRTVSDLEDNTDPTGFFTMQPDAEHIADDLFEAWLKIAEEKKQRAKLYKDMQARFVFTCTDRPGIFRTKKLNPARMNELRRKDRAALAQQWKAKEILNFLPAEEAWAIWNANVEVGF